MISDLGIYARLWIGSYSKVQNCNLVHVHLHSIISTDRGLTWGSVGGEWISECEICTLLGTIAITGNPHFIQSFDTTIHSWQMTDIIEKIENSSFEFIKTISILMQIFE